MFSIFITSPNKSSHKLGETPDLVTAMTMADGYAFSWHESDTKFEVWRGGNRYYFASHKPDDRRKMQAITPEKLQKGMMEATATAKVKVTPKSVGRSAT